LSKIKLNGSYGGRWNYQPYTDDPDDEGRGQGMYRFSMGHYIKENEVIDCDNEPSLRGAE